MSTKVSPPPDRFTIRRTGSPDRLAPAIVIPAVPDTEPAPDTALPITEPVPVPAHRRV